MATTYQDYLWFNNDEFAGWRATGHVVSLIRDSTAAGVLDSLGAVGRRGTGVGYDGFGQRTMEFEDLGLTRPNPHASPTVQTVGVADIGDGWVLLIQHNSDYLGIDDTLFGPVVRHHEVVSHFSNVNANNRFVWWRDGQQVVSFEPMSPTMDLEHARATAPDDVETVLAIIAEVGGIDLDDYEGTRTEFFHIEGSFALAERLTGVEVSKELLESAEFTVAMIPTIEPHDPDTHDLPPRVPLLGDRATWSDVHQLYRSSAEATVHATMVLSDSGSGSAERHEAEFWYSPFAGTRQVDAQGLLSVSDNRGAQWYRGPYFPDTWPENLIAIHRRWGTETPFGSLIDPTTAATPTEVNGQRAWEFVFPPEFLDGHPVAVVFDAHTGIVLRAENVYRTEELSNVIVDESFNSDLFAVPD